MPHPHFPHLFTPTEIRGVELRNRVAISGHFAGWWVDKGLPSDAFVAYLEERAKGGVGLFVIGATSPERGSGWMESVDDRIIPRYRALTEAGHRHGTKVFAQLCHPGFRPLPGLSVYGTDIAAEKTQPEYVAPDRYVPTVEDLQRLVAAFAAAAGRAAEGGVDGVELHSHESFLHAQLLNPYWNERTDEYGGSLGNRMRFLLETLTAMRAAIGDRLPLGVRLKLDDMEQRGMDDADYREAVRRLEAAGLVDYVNFTGGDGRLHHGPMPRPEGEWLPLVRRMRAATGLKMMHAGRLSTPEMAEQALAEDLVDVVCMTKTHICDPHFTRKVYENRLPEIRYCTRCLQACHGAMGRMTCVYNPLTSREVEWSELRPAERRKRVVVVGGGPAGMEAALTAAQRGHDVIVLERESQVGGQVRTGAASPLRRNWGRIAEFYERQGARGLFEVRLGAAATPEAVLALEPDAVVVATGSRPLRLQIPGGPLALTVHEVVVGAADAARRVVVYDTEGFNRPLVAADYLSSRGIKVEVVTPLAQLWPMVEGMMRDEAVQQLLQRGVRFAPGEKLVGWEGAGRLRLRSVRTATERVVEGIDAVVGTVGSEAVDELSAALRPHVPELHVIGDANLPQTVEDATYQGARIGRRI
jgi:2,4-dienoyl-CoA reductase-like NADH-dependent reductase (Old Yellow Enzyme family)/thioredoxin reductase